MTTGRGYETLLDGVRAAASSFGAASGPAIAEWDDSLGRAVGARVQEAADHGEGVTRAVEQQAEEHRRLDELAELVEQHARVVRERVDASVGAAREAREELDRAADLAEEARAAARASGDAVDQALRVASTAGVECGKAVSFGELDGMVQQQVVRARKAAALRMAATAAAHEVAGQAVEEAVQQVLGIPDGAPAHLVDQLGDSVHVAGEITAARVRSLIKRLPKSEP